MQIVLFTFCFVYKPSTFYRFIRYAKYNNYANYSITAVKNMLETLLCRQPPLAAIRAILSGQTGTSPAINRYAAKGSLHE